MNDRGALKRRLLRTGAYTALALGALATVLACSVRRNVYLAGLPSVETPLTVASVAKRGPFLDVMLVGEEIRLRTFLPGRDDCARIAEPQAEVRWMSNGAAGRVQRGEMRCDAVGIGSLADWRTIRPPAHVASGPVPREQASYRVAYGDEDLVLLRGQFPLARLIGWSGFADTLAAVPNSASCREAIQEGVASMQYYPTGEPVLALVSGEGLCPIQGLLQPVDRHAAERR